VIYCIYSFTRFEVLTAKILVKVFWIVTPHSVVVENLDTTQHHDPEYLNLNIQFYLTAFTKENEGECNMYVLCEHPYHLI